MKNKNLIHRLKKYFMTQDIEQVSYLCASLMIDLNRMNFIEELSESEKKT